MTTLSSKYQKYYDLLPGGVSSPVRALKGANRDPLIIKEALGDLIIDIDDNEYIDFCASWGALILGHSHPQMTATLAEQLQKGTSYGLSNLMEYKLAQKITNHMPHIEKVRFCQSGTESTMYAIRLARGITEKDYIVKFKGNYHGCADFLLTDAGSGFATHKAMSKGIPADSVKYTLNLPYNDIDALEELFRMDEYKDKIAAVIIEPMVMNMGTTICTKEFMNRLRELTKSHSSFLIFDEVVTGFRISINGASKYYNVEPDITCLGKVMGGGLPAAAYGARKEIMDMLSPTGPIYQAGTLSGNPLAMAAGHFVISQLEEPNFFENLEKKTNLFLAPIEQKMASMKKKICVQKIASMFTIFFGVSEVKNMEDSSSSDHNTVWKFYNYLFDREIYSTP